jgi:hypothetical protein
MYSPKVIERRLKKLHAKWAFEPVRHSLEEVQSANSHLDTFLNDDGILDGHKQFGPDEEKWIKNENGICQLDFRYWYSRYATVMHWDGHSLVHQPQMSVAQNIIVDIWGEMEEQRVAIAIQQLKARQLRVSTTSISAILHRANFWPDVNALVASSDPDKSMKLAAMAELCYQHMPYWMQAPMTPPSRIGISITFGNQNSAISIQHGNQFSGIARGTTPSVVHLSEIPDWSDPENLIDAALLKAMHASPWMFLMEESTAGEMGDYWNHTWDANVKAWPKHQTIIRPVFLPWFVGSDIYPSESDMKARPIPDDWNPLDITYQHAAHCEKDVKANDYLRHYLGENWKLPRNQMWYWECEYLTARQKKILPQFFAEMPANATEAFQSRSISVFDLDTIIRHQEGRKPPKGVYAFEGIDIPERLKPLDREIDLNKKPIIITPAWGQAHKINAIRLMPLKWQGESEDDGLDKLYIWHWPDPNYVYAEGIDMGDGVGQDRSVCEMMRKITHYEPAAQCAEFASGYVNSIDMWPMSLALGTLFSVCREGEIVQPRCVIEVRGNGDNTQQQMRLRGWTKFHLWSRIDNRRPQQHLQSQKIGWYTNSWSRPQMMDWIVKFLRDELLEINSPWFVKEMKTLSRDESTQSFRADRGHHDDRICAMAFVLHSLHSFELVETDPSVALERIKKRFKGRVWMPSSNEEEIPADVMRHQEMPQELFGFPRSPQECDEFDRALVPSEVGGDNMAEW